MHEYRVSAPPLSFSLSLERLSSSSFYEVWKNPARFTTAASIGLVSLASVSLMDSPCCLSLSLVLPRAIDKTKRLSWLTTLGLNWWAAMRWRHSSRIIKKEAFFPERKDPLLHTRNTLGEWKTQWFIEKSRNITFIWENMNVKVHNYFWILISK